MWKHDNGVSLRQVINIRRMIMKEMKKVVLIMFSALFLIFNYAAAQTASQPTPQASLAVAADQATPSGSIVKSKAMKHKKPAVSLSEYSIKGSNLMKDGQVVKMTGAFAPYMATLDEKQIDSAFADFKQADVRVIEILASYRGDKPYAFETEFGKYNESAFKKLDYIVSKASQNNIKLIIALCDNSPDFGGKEVYETWTQGSNSNVLFEDKISREYYKKFMDNLLERTNTITGARYSEDPAIFAWDLCSGVEDENDKDGSVLYAWADEMSSHLKSKDKNHFVTMSMKKITDSADRINPSDVFLLPGLDLAYYNIEMQEKGDINAMKKDVTDSNKMFYKNTNKPVIMGFSDAAGSAPDAFEISKIFFDFGTVLVYNNAGTGDFAKKPGAFDMEDTKTVEALKEASKSAGIIQQEIASLEISNIITKPGDKEAAIDFTSKAGVEASVSYGGSLPFKLATDKITLQSKKGTIKLAGLNPDTKYMFMIKAADANEAGISQVISFSTKKIIRQIAKPFSTSNNFIKAKGADFYDGNRVYRFLGSENYYLKYANALDYAKKYNNDVPGYIFTQAKKMGLKNMRVFTMEEGFSMDTINKETYSKHEYLRIGPDFFDEQAYKTVDGVLASAKKHGIRLTLCFVDNWDYNGGVKTLAKWAGVTKNAFWTNEKCKEYYRQNVQKLVLRKNTVNGILYKDDPTIFSWDLCNEPRDEDDTSAKTIAAWINEMAAYVKSLDKNHMVTAGLEGYYLKDDGTHYSGTDFILCQQSKDIDYTTFHIYPASQWSHFSQSTVDYMFKKWIKDSHEVLKKPVVMEEYGIGKGMEEYPRADWIDFMTKDFIELGGNGANYWFLVDPDYAWGDGNEFTPNDTDIVNIFVKYSDELNKNGY